MFSVGPVWGYITFLQAFFFKVQAWLFGNSSRTEPAAMLNVQVKLVISLHFSVWRKGSILLTHLDESAVVNVPLGQLTLMQTSV